MLHRLRFAGVLFSVFPANVALGQTPSEVQKTQGFGGGEVFGGGLDIEHLDALRGSPGNDVAVYWALNRNKVWSRGSSIFADGLEGEPNPFFGLSLDMDGDYCVVGAPLDDVNGVDEAGAAYFFVLDRQSLEWIQLQRITASDGGEVDHFGWAIALDGDTLAIGAISRGHSNHGGVYIFELIDGVWTETQFLLSGNLTSDDKQFGDALALDGDRLVVGAPYFDESGRAFVYERDANGLWQETAKLQGATWDGELFGSDVDLIGDLIVVGAPFAYEEEERGDFRVFRFDGATWNVEWRWYQVPPDILEGVGVSVAIADSGDVIYVGSREAEFFKGGVGDGNIRVFHYDPNEQEWFETDLFRPIDQIPGTEQAFATDIAVDGDWLVAGAPGDNGGGGAVYFYDLTGQMGTRTLLVDAAVQFGSLLSGGVSSLKDSEDSRLRIRSRFNFTGTDTTIADLRIGATNYVANPALLNLLIEGRITQAGGTMKVRLRDWNTNAFDQVHQYAIGAAENVVQVSDIPAANYIRSSDNRVEVSLRASALVNFATLGFEEQIDFVNVLVKD